MADASAGVMAPPVATPSSPMTASPTQPRRRPRRWLTLTLAATLAGGLAYGAYVWSFADRVAFLPPLLLAEPLQVRHDGHGQGGFGAPRSGHRVHHGVDLAAPLGTPVRAAKSGWVTVARNDRRGKGNYVLVSHGGGLATLYAHLARLDVQAGWHVRQGQMLGIVGKTGNARARNITAHLHFEVHQDGRPVDPMGYLPAGTQP